MTDDPMLAAQAAIQQLRAAVAAHLRGERVVALYLAGGSPRRTIAMLGAAEAGLRAAGQGDGLLTCTGADFAGLWRDTLQRGLTHSSVARWPPSRPSCATAWTRSGMNRSPSGNWRA